MTDEIREDWEHRQRAALLPFDHAYPGPRSRATGILRVFRWLLTLVVVAVILLVLISIAARM